MKPILILACFWLFANGVFAQHNLDSSFIYAERGKSVVFTFKVKKDSSLCGFMGKYYLWRADNLTMSGFVDGQVTLLNDSTCRIISSIPNVFLDGTVLSLRRVYQPYIIDEDECDSIAKDTAVIVMGGAYAPGFYAFTPNTVKRGETVTVRIDAKGLKLKGKKVRSIRLSSVNGYYELNVSGPTIPNDSQATVTFTVPKNLPDGNYDTDVDLNEAGVSPMNYAFVVVEGGKDMPVIKAVSPGIIGRGEEKDVFIQTGGTEFVSHFPMVRISGNEVENYTVVNDSTIKCKLKISTADSGYKYVEIGSYYDGWMVMDSAILVSGGKPFARLSLDREYAVTRGQKVTVVVKGENTHFTNPGLTMDFGYPTYNVTIDTVLVKDSVTLHVHIKVDDEFYGRFNFSHTQFIYSDAEISDPVMVEKFIAVVPDETQAYVVKMDPPYFYRNSIANYTFTIRNTELTKCDEEAGWFFQTYSLPNLQVPYLSEHRILNDSTIVCKIEFDEYFTDSACAIGFHYSSAGGYVITESFVVGHFAGNTALQESAKHKFVQAKVYPNPVKDKLLIENGKNILNFTLMTLTGKEISIDPRLMNLRDNGQLEVDIAAMGLENGLYFVRIEMVNGVACQKIVISRQ